MAGKEFLQKRYGLIGMSTSSVGFRKGEESLTMFRFTFQHRLQVGPCFLELARLNEAFTELQAARQRRQPIYAMAQLMQ